MKIRTFTPFLMILASCAALATSFLERPFPETVQDAPYIVRGKIGGSRVDWAGTGEGRRIYTFYELELDEVMKGNVPGRAITIRELGGQKDGVGMQVSGTAKFERGEDVVVTLGERNPDDSYDLRGLMMGKYNVRQNKSGIEVLERPGLVEGHSDHVKSPGEKGQGDSHPQKEWTLESLRKLVQEQQSGAPSRAARPDSPAIPQPQVSASFPTLAQPSGATSPAPRLQPQEEGDLAKATTSRKWIGIGLASLLGVLVAGLVLRRLFS